MKKDMHALYNSYYSYLLWRAYYMPANVYIISVTPTRLCIGYPLLQDKWPENIVG